MSEQKPNGPGVEAPATPPRRMYPLANDVEGNPIRMPREAVAWRVKQLARRAGRPKLIFDQDTGRALELPLTVTHQDLAEHVGVSGRYRLEAIDMHGSVIPGCVAITEIWFEDQEDEAQPAAAAAPVVSNDAIAQLMALVGKLVETNSEVMQTMVSAFGKIDPNAGPPEQPQAAAAAAAAAAGGLPPNLAALGALGPAAAIPGVIEMFFNHVKPGAPGAAGAAAPMPGVPFAAAPFMMPGVVPGVVAQPQATIPLVPVGPLMPIGQQGQK